MNNNIKTKNIPFWISVTIFVVLFLAIGIYTYRNMKYVFSGVTVEARIEKAEKESNLFNLNGNAKHANFISINGREISIDKNGDFKEKIVLPDGYSIITIFARDKFGKDVEKTIETYISSGDIVAYERKNNY